MPWIDVADAKVHLNKTTTADDAELTGFVNAACAMVEQIVGHVDLTTVAETLRAERAWRRSRYWSGWDPMLLLSETPVYAITTVEQGSGRTITTIPEEDPLAGVLGWRLDGNVVHLPVGTNGCGDSGTWVGAFVVTYQAGYPTAPANYRLAALELVAHLWRTSQMNAAAGRARGTEADTEWMRGSGSTYALPFRVRELLGIYGQTVPVDGGGVLA